MEPEPVEPVSQTEPVEPELAWVPRANGSPRARVPKGQWVPTGQWVPKGPPWDPMDGRQIEVGTRCGKEPPEGTRNPPEPFQQKPRFRSMRAEWQRQLVNGYLGGTLFHYCTLLPLGPPLGPPMAPRGEGDP